MARRRIPHVKDIFCEYRPVTGKHHGEELVWAIEDTSAKLHSLTGETDAQDYENAIKSIKFKPRARKLIEECERSVRRRRSKDTPQEQTTWQQSIGENSERTKYRKVRKSVVNTYSGPEDQHRSTGSGVVKRVRHKQSKSTKDKTKSNPDHHSASGVRYENFHSLFARRPITKMFHFGLNLEREIGLPADDVNLLKEKIPEPETRSAESTSYNTRVSYYGTDGEPIRYRQSESTARSPQQVGQQGVKIMQYTNNQPNQMAADRCVLESHTLENYGYPPGGTRTVIQLSPTGEQISKVHEIRAAGPRHPGLKHRRGFGSAGNLFDLNENEEEEEDEFADYHKNSGTYKRNVEITTSYGRDGRPAYLNSPHSRLHGGEEAINRNSNEIFSIGIHHTRPENVQPPTGLSPQGHLTSTYGKVSIDQDTSDGSYYHSPNFAPTATEDSLSLPHYENKRRNPLFEADQKATFGGKFDGETYTDFTGEANFFTTLERAKLKHPERGSEPGFYDANLYDGSNLSEDSGIEQYGDCDEQIDTNVSFGEKEVENIRVRKPQAGNSYAASEMRYSTMPARSTHGSRDYMWGSYDDYNATMTYGAQGGGNIMQFKEYGGEDFSQYLRDEEDDDYYAHMSTLQRQQKKKKRSPVAHLKHNPADTGSANLEEGSTATLKKKLRRVLHIPNKQHDANESELTSHLKKFSFADSKLSKDSATGERKSVFVSDANTSGKGHQDNSGTWWSPDSLNESTSQVNTEVTLSRRQQRVPKKDLMYFDSNQFTGGDSSENSDTFKQRRELVRNSEKPSRGNVVKRVSSMLTPRENAPKLGNRRKALNPLQHRSRDDSDVGM